MAFMEPQVAFGKLYVVELLDGSSNLIPADDVRLPTGFKFELSTEDNPIVYSNFPREVRSEFGSIAGGEINTIELREGYFTRLSAPGYLDCTEWNGPFASESEARKDLAETYDLCESCLADLDTDWDCSNPDCEAFPLNPDNPDYDPERAGPEIEDLIVGSDGRGGYFIGRYECGRIVGTFESYHAAIKEIPAIMESEKFWPNVWEQSERGDFRLIRDLETEIAESAE